MTQIETELIQLKIKIKEMLEAQNPKDFLQAQRDLKIMIER